VATDSSHSKYSILIKKVLDVPVYEFFNDDIYDRQRIIIYLHGFSSSTEENLRYLFQFARDGFFVLGIDAREHGLRRSESLDASDHLDRSKRTERFYRIMMGTQEDVLRVIEHYLSSGSGQNEKTRIGVFGVSMGGMIAYGLPVIEKRIAAVAPTISSPDWLAGIFWPGRYLSRKTMRKISELNPIGNFGQIPPLPILIQNATDDHVLPAKYTEKHLARMKDQYGDANEKIVYMKHSGGHELTSRMIENAADWFSQYI